MMKREKGRTWVDDDDEEKEEVVGVEIGMCFSRSS